MKLVCISDTHGDHQQVTVPAGDVLIHAGDVTAHGTERDLQDFLKWFGSQPHQHKLFVAGNHDLFLENSPKRTQALADRAGVVWLNDSGTLIDGGHFWGSPITLRFHDWSFMRNPGADIQRHWEKLPDNTDVLITHGPPHGILDRVQRADGSEERTGCPQLLAKILEVQPKLHVFGHIHEEYGVDLKHDIDFLNVSTMNQFYRIAQQPVTYTLQHAMVNEVSDRD